MADLSKNKIKDVVRKDRRTIFEVMENLSFVFGVQLYVGLESLPTNDPGADESKSYNSELS
jgi:hypothetical protein